MEIITRKSRDDMFQIFLEGTEIDCLRLDLENLKKGFKLRNITQEILTKLKEVKDDK